MSFDGDTFVPHRPEDPGSDEERLGHEMACVRAVLIDHEWHVVSEFDHCGPSAATTARIRDFRKEKNGGYTVESRYVRKGVWEYRLLDPAKPEDQAPVSPEAKHPPSVTRVGRVTIIEQPKPVAQWRCAVCNSPPANPVQVSFDPTYGIARCKVCGKRKTAFRLV